MFPDRKSSNGPRPSRLVAGGEAAPFDLLLCGPHLAKLAPTDLSKPTKTNQAYLYPVGAV